MRMPLIVYNSEVAKASNQELHAFLYRDLMEKIIRGDLSPGQRLIEEDLARAYKVSRTPIRDVLLAFQKDGLVKRVRNCGATVMQFTPEDVEELFDIRKALEIHCLAKALRTIKLSDLVELEQRLLSLECGSGRQWQRQHSDIDLKLHYLIVCNSGNRRLIAYMKHLSLLIQTLQLASAFDQEEHVRRTGEQHLAIIRAIESGNLELAERLLCEHIEFGKRNAIELVVKSQADKKLAATQST